MFRSAQKAKEYICGEAVVTLRSLRTGDSFTYYIAPPTSKNPDDILFVNVLTGNGDYRNIGMILKNRSFRKSSVTTVARDAQSAAAFQFCIAALNDNRIPATLEITAPDAEVKQRDRVRLTPPSSKTQASVQRKQEEFDRAYFNGTPEERDAALTDLCASICRRPADR